MGMAGGFPMMRFLSTGWTNSLLQLNCCSLCPVAVRQAVQQEGAPGPGQVYNALMHAQAPIAPLEVRNIAAKLEMMMKAEMEMVLKSPW